MRAAELAGNSMAVEMGMSIAERKSITRPDWSMGKC